MDDTTADDLQDDTGSDPNKRPWFIILNILYISSHAMSSARREEGGAFNCK